MATKAAKAQTLYPIHVRGAEEFTGRKEYLLFRTADFKKQFKDNARPDWVKALLEIVESGAELKEGSPDEHFKMADIIKKDLDRGKERVKELEAEKNQKLNREQQLVKSVTEGGRDAAITRFQEKFDDTSRGITPKGEVTPEDWYGALAYGFMKENTSQWLIADAVVALEDAGYENAVEHACGAFGKAYPTVSAYARVSRALPPAERAKYPGLTFTAVQVIANASFSDKPAVQAKTVTALLEKASEEHWDSKVARDKVSEKQGKTTPTPPPKRDFLVIKDGVPTLHRTAPDAFDKKVLVLNIAKLQYSAEVPKPGGKKGEVIVDWTPILEA